MLHVEYQGSAALTTGLPSGARDRGFGIRRHRAGRLNFKLAVKQARGESRVIRDVRSRLTGNTAMTGVDFSSYSRRSRQCMSGERFPAGVAGRREAGTPVTYIGPGQSSSE